MKRFSPFAEAIELPEPTLSIQLTDKYLRPHNLSANLSGLANELL